MKEGQPADALKPCDKAGRWERYALRNDDHGMKIYVESFVVPGCG